MKKSARKVIIVWKAQQSQLSALTVTMSQEKVQISVKSVQQASTAQLLRL